MTEVILIIHIKVLSTKIDSLSDVGSSKGHPGTINPVTVIYLQYARKESTQKN